MPELETINIDELCKDIDDDNRSISTFDPEETDVFQSDESTSYRVLNRRDLLKSMYRLSKKQRWIETLSRRFKTFSLDRYIQF